MGVRRRINRRAVFLLNLIISIHSGPANASDGIIKSLPRQELQGSAFACAGVGEISQEGNIYLEVKGRPAYLQEGHFHVLENALVSLYEEVAKETCSSGYRHLTGARVNRGSIPDTTDVVTFVIDFEVTGRCKGCADNIDFLSHFRRQRRIRATLQKSSHRWLSSKKGSKKSSGSSGYYYQNYADSSSSSSRYYYGYTPMDPPSPPPSGSTSSCYCPPPAVEGLEYAFQRIVRDVLDLLSIYDGTPRLGGDDDGAPIFPTPTLPSPTMMPNPSPTQQPNSDSTPPPTVMMPNPTPLPTTRQVDPTEPPISPPPTATPSATPSSVKGPSPPSTPSAQPSVLSDNPSGTPSVGQDNNVCDAKNNPIDYRSPNCDKDSQEGYQICLEFLNMPCEDAPLLDEAVAFWESVITADVPDRFANLPKLDDPAYCGPGHTVPSPVDDLFICGLYTDLDGEGGVLGTGTNINDGSGIPRPTKWGIMRLDSADIARFQSDRSLFYDIVLHEIGHILGIGNSWRLANEPLVNSNCEYTGAQAVAVYRELSGCTNGFPLAECGNGHWSETCFNAELMTPTRNFGGILISEMSVATLDDMGYTTDRNAINYDFRSFDIDESCRCNNPVKVPSGSVWQWNKPIKHKDPPLTPELLEKARKVAPPVVVPALESNENSDGENITIGATSTVLFWNEEASNFFEVTIY